MDSPAQSAAPASAWQLIIMGEMAAGKTTASDRLAERYGARTWTISQMIKRVSHALVDRPAELDTLLELVLPDSRLRDLGRSALLQFGETYEMTGTSKVDYRALYQDVGEILRHLHPETRFCWEEELARRIAAVSLGLVHDAAPATERAVIDVRAKESHYFFCTLHGYRSLRIVAPLEVRRARILGRDGVQVIDESVFTHPSETDVRELPFDFTIDNGADDPTHTSLYAALDDVVAQLSR